METASGSVMQLNLYILQTISQLARADVAEAMLRFEISKDTAEALAKLNTAELFEISKSPVFLFEINQDSIINALKDREQGHGYRSMQKMIANISALTIGVDNEKK